MPVEQATPTKTYTCPMHPAVRQDTPGKCPKCGMDLIPEGSTAEDGRMAQSRGPPELKAGDHAEMVRQMRAPWLWTNFTVIALGLWLITAPFTFGYDTAQASEGVTGVTVERALPSPAVRSAATTWNDIISGTLLMVLGAVSLWPYPRNDFWGRWGVCFVGIWLQFAPLVFWPPSPAAYVNDTLIGAFVIGLSVLVPMMPGMAHHMAMMQPGPIVPPGWTYNPSSWHQRAPLIALGFIGWFISRGLAAVQFGYLPSAWEPFFGEGTLRVLHSDVSRSWPISDAGLGAVAYTFETLMGFMGGVSRWRTMPWMVAFFGILVIPLGITHVVLVVLQPVVVGYWCTLCLAAAAAMLVMIPLTVDEVVAMCQFLARAVREGQPFWRTFWVGGTLPEENQDTRTPPYGAPLQEVAPATVWGVTVPWPLLVSTALGIWLMAAPDVLQSAGAAANSDRLIGALIVTTAVIAMAEVVRIGRFLNVLCGIWLIAAPWLLNGFSAGSQWNAIVTGAVLILLSVPRGAVREHYGNWDRCVI